MYKYGLENTKVKIHTKRKGVNKYNGEIGVYIETIERPVGYINLVQVNGIEIKLYDSEFEFLEQPQKEIKLRGTNEIINEAKAEVMQHFAKLNKDEKINLIKSLKKSFAEGSDLIKMYLGNIIVELELQI